MLYESSVFPVHNRYRSHAPTDVQTSRYTRTHTLIKIKRRWKEKKKKSKGGCGAWGGGEEEGGSGAAGGRWRRPVIERIGDFVPDFDRLPGVENRLENCPKLADLHSGAAFF